MRLDIYVILFTKDFFVPKMNIIILTPLPKKSQNTPIPVATPVYPNPPILRSYKQTESL